MKIEKILFCTDLSRNSRATFQYAIDIAEHHDAEIYVLYVTEKISREQLIAMNLYTEGDHTIESVRKKQAELANTEFHKCQEKFWADMPKDKQGLKKLVQRGMIAEGHAADEILSHSKRDNCDLIVMGTSRKGVMHNFLGSVIKSVLRRSEIPTLVIPTTDNK